MFPKSLFFALVFLLSTLSFQTAKGQTLPPDELVHDLMDQISQDSLLKHIQILEDAGGTRSRISFTPGKDSAAAYLYDTFKSMPGLSAVWLDTFYVEYAHPPYDTVPQVNVVAKIEGALFPDSYYVIGGHYDTTSDRDDDWGHMGAHWQTIEAPGANDNGTGVAAVLEIARVLSDPENRFQPDYTLVFVAFGVEERIPQGLRQQASLVSHVGSRHMAQTASANNDDVLGMISIDMVGYNDHYDYTALVTHDNSIQHRSVNFGMEFYQANQDYDVDLIMNDPPFAVGAYSDHDTFADEGYPAVLVIEAAPPWRNTVKEGFSPHLYLANPYYHKTTDTWERINMGLVRKVTQLNLATIASFGGQAVETDAYFADLQTPDAAGEIILSGNYPNPFNPVTRINFELPHSAHVSLAIFDITGSRIATLVDQNLSAGKHSIPFDAAGGRNLSSGIYLYRLQSGTFSATGKMTLVK